MSSQPGMPDTFDFSRSYFRFYIDLENNQAISLSHKPPTRTNRTRINIEATCRLTHQPTGQASLYLLSSSCKAEQVGAAKNELWIQPNADVCFLLSDDGQFAIFKSWSHNNPGVMRVPESLGEQPERQYFMADENFDDLAIDLHPATPTPLDTFDQIKAGILGSNPLVSRITYEDGDYQVQIDQPVKTINLAERDDVFQTDTGPIILPDLSARRVSEAGEMMIKTFDLAFSAFHQSDWAEFVINAPIDVKPGVSVNHYSEFKHVEPTRNQILMLP